MHRFKTARVIWGVAFCLLSASCQQDIQHDDDPWRLDDEPVIDAGYEGPDLEAVPRADGELCDVPGQQGRCAKGRWRIQEGKFVCEALYRAMPEICNGEDSDCDGLIDYGDTQTPYTFEIILQRMKTFDALSQELIEQGVAPERLERLLEFRVCPEFRHCILSASPPEEPAAHPYESVLDEFDAFFVSPPNEYPTCTAD